MLEYLYFIPFFQVFRLTLKMSRVRKNRRKVEKMFAYWEEYERDLEEVLEELMESGRRVQPLLGRGNKTNE